MAQDFHAAFGVGADDKRISTVDTDGVALAALQGLYEIAQEKDVRIATLEARLEAIEEISGVDVGGVEESRMLSSGVPLTWLFVAGLALATMLLAQRSYVAARRRGA